MSTWRRGAVTALAGLGAAEAVAAGSRSRSLVDAAGQVVVDVGPLPLVELTVKLFKTADKPVIRAAVVATVVAGGGLLGRTPDRWLRSGVTAAAVASGVAIGRRRAATGAGTAEAAGVVRSAVAGLLTVLGVSALPPAALFPAALAGGAGLAASLRGQAARRAGQDTISRSLTLDPGTALPPAVDGGEEWWGVSPLLTPVEDFYVTDVNMRPPVVDIDAWRLSVTGTVGESLTLSYDDLLDLPLVEFDATMVCIHNRLGWDRLGTARWTGIPLARLLAAAGPDPASAVLVTRAVDGWECSIALRTLEQMSAYVVVGMDGRPLTAAHGFPARVFVPGVYGQYTGAKWLSELRLQTLPNRDYWLPRGWSRGPVLVRPLSRIDTPADRGRVSAGPTDVLGVAWAPPGGVSAVQVAVGDEPWADAELADELAPAAWRRWRIRVALAPGQHRLRARCVAHDGTVQDDTLRPPFPTGASGHHIITVNADG
ncbi:MAG: molybdopterin-dependent oxidoreductase [Nocardioides sp.]